MCYSLDDCATNQLNVHSVKRLIPWQWITNLIFVGIRKYTVFDTSLTHATIHDIKPNDIRTEISENQCSLLLSLSPAKLYFFCKDVKVRGEVITLHMYFFLREDFKQIVKRHSR